MRSVVLVAVTALASAATAGDELREAAAAKCLERLRQALAGEEFWPAMHAAEALTLAGEGETVRKALRPRLAAEDDAQRRCGLARELVRAGDKSVLGVLFDVLASPDPYGHVHAAESLFKVAEVADGLLLRRAAGSANAKLRLMAAAALARCGSPRALEIIRTELGSSDRDAAQIAAWILGQIGDATDIAPLRANLAKETDPLKRAYVINALAALGDEQGGKLLLENLGHADGAVRTYSAEFAGHARLHQAAERLESLRDDPVTDVRVRAAHALIALARPAESAEVIVRDVYRASAANPRFSEGSIVELADGKLLFAITQFVGSGQDHSTAQIVARTSPDGGRTWSDERVLQANVGKQNVMSVTLRRLTHKPVGAAEIGLFYLVKNSGSDLKVYLRISRDEAQSFGPPICVTAAPGYHVMNNDRVLLTGSGRLVCPISWTRDVVHENHFVSFCYLSDDGGRSWRRSEGVVDLPQRGAMEPETLELADGRLLMILRTQLGAIFVSRSADGGSTWGRPESWNVVAPEAPATLRRIPATGHLLLVYNPEHRPGAGHGGARTPLAIAVSADEGATWRRLPDLETRADQTYAYTSALFVKDWLVLSYYVADGTTGRISTRFRSLPVRRLYR